MSGDAGAAWSVERVDGNGVRHVVACGLSAWEAEVLAKRLAARGSGKSHEAVAGGSS